MDTNMETANDVITIVSEPGALTFATRREWFEVNDELLDTLQNSVVKRAFTGKPNTVYFMFNSISPLDRDRNCSRACLLLKIQAEEAWNQRFYGMYMTRDEAEQLMKNRVMLWE